MFARVDGEPGVVKGCPSPGRCGVAGLAGGREEGSNMVRAGDTRVLRLVTRITIRRCGREVPMEVAVRAGHGGMNAGQGKGRVVMVKLG
jgi:hypothetical protein